MKTVSKINEDLYKLLELGKINKIIRHYKIIKKNFNNSNGNIIFYQIPSSDLEPSKNDHYSYSNIFYSKPSNIIDNDYNRDLDIDGPYIKIQDIKNSIDIEKNKAYDDFLNDVTNDDFTAEEKNELNRVVNNYNYNNDHYYIRLYPYEDNDRSYAEWKKLLIDHFINIVNKEYLNNIENKEAFYKENDMPGYSDIILYSESKYNTVKNIEDNEFKDE